MAKELDWDITRTEADIADDCTIAPVYFIRDVCSVLDANDEIRWEQRGGMWLTRAEAEGHLRAHSYNYTEHANVDCQYAEGQLRKLLEAHTVTLREAAGRKVMRLVAENLKLYVRRRVGR
jgi:hypothetical protein